MRKTAPDGESAGELPEVTTDAHSQSTRIAKDSEKSSEEPKAAASTPPADEAQGAAEPSSVPAAAPEAGSQQPMAAAEARAIKSELDFDEAERFAASFRPSWEPDDIPAAPAVPPAPIVGAKDGVARVIRHSTRSDLQPPKLRKHRGASYAILAASLVGVAALVYLGIASSMVRPGAEIAALAPEKKKDKDRDEAARDETRFAAARNPEPAPTPAPVAVMEAPAAPQPTASEPLAAAEPGEPPLEANEPAMADPAMADPAMAGPAAPPAAEATAAAEPAAAAQPTAQAAPTPEATQAAPTTTTEPPQPELARAPQPTPEVAAPAVGAVPAPAAKTPEPPVAPKPAPQPLAAAPQQAERAPEAPKHVLLSLAAHPPNTRLKLDGAPIQNPFRARLPRSSRHRIEAQAPGYAPEVQTVRLENDVQLMISLKREREEPPPVKPDPYPDARRSAATQPGPGHARDRGPGFVSDNPY